MRQPANADALHMLGVLAMQVGQFDRAVELIKRAIVLAPDAAEAHSNLGNALKYLGRLDDAIASYRQGIRIKSDAAEMYSNLGGALKDAGDIEQAMECYRQAIRLKPDSAAAHNSLGNALYEKGELNEAIAAYRQALRLHSDYADAHYNLGIALRDLGQPDEAIASYRQAVRIKPDFAVAYSNLGIALHDVGKTDGAIAAYHEAIRLNPKLVKTYTNLGNALGDVGKIDEAITAYRQGIELQPDYAEAYNNLGNILKDIGKLDEAIAAYRQAIRIKPENNLAASNLIYAIQFHRGYDARRIGEEHRQWNRRFAAPLGKFLRPHSNDCNSDRKLRIGYVSPDFRNHVVGRNLLPLLRQHDHEQMEIFCYSNMIGGDGFTEQIRSCADVWRDIARLSDSQAADLIRRDRIDILVDLTLHMANNRLLIFAHKPAPVQVTYLGYCSSTGLETMDYRLSDPYLDPAESDLSVYSERTIWLPETYWCYNTGGAMPEASGPPVETAGYVTFGCLNNFGKVPPALDLWAEILKNVPRSRLMIHCSPGAHVDSARDRFASQGISPDRLEFPGQQSWEKYVGTYDRIDIALDPFPWGGGITTCDALWMGVPVVSLVGRTAVGRGGASILTNIGMPELIAKTAEEYVSIAVRLANDLARLAEMRRTLRGRMQGSPLMDAGRFARNVEAAYREMWRKWCATGGDSAIGCVKA